MSEATLTHLTPEQYADAALARVAQLAHVSVAAVTVDQLEANADRCYCLEVRAACIRLAQNKRKAEQKAKDKALLEKTYAAWVAAGSPVSALSSREGLIGLAPSKAAVIGEGQL